MKKLYFICALFLFACVPVEDDPLQIPRGFMQAALNSVEGFEEFEAIAKYDYASGTWYLLDDNDHTPKNVTSVSVGGGGALFINFPYPVAEYHSTSATPDELTMAYNLGISGHTNELRILFSVPGYAEIKGVLEYDGSLWSFQKYPSYENATIVSQTSSKIVLDHIDCSYNLFTANLSGPNFWVWSSNPSNTKTKINYSGIPTTGDKIYFSRISVIPKARKYKCDELPIPYGMPNIWVRGSVKFDKN